MKTTITSYLIDTATPEGAQQYKELKAKLNRPCFNTWGGNSHYRPEFATPTEITLETKQLFNNQWNATPGGRVFDWAEDYPINFRKTLKKGHYLELTPEMVNIRKTRHTCGYCGKQTDSPKSQFCPHCLGSEYLKPEELHLTRLQPVASTKDREPLNAAEFAIIKPLYDEAQAEARAKRNEKKRADLIKQRDAEIEKATTRAAGLIWLLDHQFPIENVIYYDHKKQFCLGWRTAPTQQEISAFLDLASEFPFGYSIKGTTYESA